MTEPKQGELWIVEAYGEVTIGQCEGPGAWLFCGSARAHRVGKNFRAIRKLDLGALVDREDAAKDRLIWLLIEAAGGKIEVGRPVLDNFNHQRATIEQHSEVGTGSIVFRSTLRATEDDRTNRNDDRGRSPRAP
jgi:hypothetical protein